MEQAGELPEGTSAVWGIGQQIKGEGDYLAQVKAAADAAASGAPDAASKICGLC